MAIVLMDGYDYYTAALAAGKGWGKVPDSMVSGRLGGQAARYNGNSGGGVFVRKLPSTYTTLIFGFAYRLNSANAGFTVGVAGLSPDATPTKTVDLSLNTGYNLAISGHSGATVLSVGSWYYIEVKAVINGASGSLEVHLNGAVEIASFTVNLGTTPLGYLYLNFPGSSVTNGNDYDDIYVCDNSGAANTSFLGDCRIETLYPGADGAHTQWTPDTGSAHYARVDETTPDGDSSYVRDNNVGDRDSYAFTDLATLAGSVFGVQTQMYARKDIAGTRQLAAVARPGSTDHDGAAATLGTSYAFFSEIREQNPDTSAAWTIGDVNGSEFGVKVVA